jgi:hypothetical protein
MNYNSLKSGVFRYLFEFSTPLLAVPIKNSIAKSVHFHSWLAPCRHGWLTRKYEDIYRIQVKGPKGLLDESLIMTKIKFPAPEDFWSNCSAFCHKKNSKPSPKTNRPG